MRVGKQAGGQGRAERERCCRCPHAGAADGAVAHSGQLHPGDAQQLWNVAQLRIAACTNDAHPVQHIGAGCGSKHLRTSGLDKAAPAAALLLGGSLPPLQHDRRKKAQEMT